MPSEAAGLLADRLGRGQKVARIFAPKERGLEISGISAYRNLMRFCSCPMPVRKQGKRTQIISHQEHQRFLEHLLEYLPEYLPEYLLEHFTDALLRLRCLHGGNVDYFFLPSKYLMGCLGIKRSRFDALTGLCRQIRHRISADCISHLLLSGRDRALRQRS